MIVAQALTASAVDDASTGLDLIETMASSARTVTADAAYDTLAFYETANTRGTTVVVPPGEDSHAVPTQPAVERSRWDDQKDQQDWAPSMEEGGRLSSTGPRRERVLPVQVDSRRSTSKSDSRSASCRIGACVQRAQSNDRAWSTRVVRDRSVTTLAWERSGPVSIYATTPYPGGGVGAGIVVKGQSGKAPHARFRPDDACADGTLVMMPADGRVPCRERGAGASLLIHNGRRCKWIPVDKERALKSAADFGRGVAGSVSSGSRRRWTLRRRLETGRWHRRLAGPAKL